MITNFEKIEEMATAQTSMENDGIILEVVRTIQHSTMMELIELRKTNKMTEEEQDLFCQNRNKEKFIDWLQQEAGKNDNRNRV